MKKEAEILIEYVQADFCQRVSMFLQFPDLRDDFQEIERTYLAPQIGCSASREKHGKQKCFRNLSLLAGAFR